MSAELKQSLLITVQVHLQMTLGNYASSRDILAFPDTGANVCLIGPQQLNTLGISLKLISAQRVSISVAGGSQICAVGKFQAKIVLNNRETSQTIYFSNQADIFFLSRQACIALAIVPSSFPYPPKCVAESIACIEAPDVCGPPLVRATPPEKPGKIPFEPVEENVPKLKQFLLKKFASSAFNVTKPFPKLSTPPARIHLKPEYIIPKPAFWPATVADHWAEEVRASIERDVSAGVLTKVPFNEPTVWCARMVVVRKKDGRPRRTVDYQQLNSQCLREPNYGESPFHTARRVPSNSWKSTFDAVDGYHSVELDEDSSRLTTFITPWGRYRYLRFPQGHCSGGDAFNGRVEHIVSNIPRLVRIVDDMCVYDGSIEDAFWHAWDVLSVCSNNGIVVNQSKFKFCLKEIEFAGLCITPLGTQLSKKLLGAIEDFPPPTDLTKARSFFGPVN